MWQKIGSDGELLAGGSLASGKRVIRQWVISSLLSSGAFEIVMNTDRPNLASMIIVSAGLLVLAGYLTLWMMAEAPPSQADTGSAAPATRAAAEEKSEGKTWEIPALASPTRYEAAADAAIDKLIKQHNARQERLGKAKLRAQCTWNLDMPGEPRAMTIAFDRAKGKASMTCGKDSCEIDGDQVTANSDSAMSVDALYLLMFRKFNAKGFVAGQGGESGQRTVVAKSETETLEFDEQTGRLAGATFRMKAGTVVVVLSDYTELPGGAGELVPTTVIVVVPAEVFPFERTRGGSIVLKVDVAGSEIRGAP